MTPACDGPPPGGDRPPGASAGAPAPTATVIPSRELLRGGREVLIAHDGCLYRLRLTRNGKLILHK